GRPHHAVGLHRRKQLGDVLRRVRHHRPVLGRPGAGGRQMKAAVFTVLFAGAAGAQTMLDQEQRLIEIHSLLIELQPVGPPGALAPGETSLGVEVIGIPTINGTTGSKTQITASDRTRVFPRPRASIGLPAPDGYRAWAGL